MEGGSVMFTPGPWTVGWSGDPEDEGKDAAGPLNIVAVNRGGVASCKPIPTGHAKTWEIVEANAALIATAPDLKAIVDALAACDPVAVDCEAWCPLCAGGGANDEDVYSAEDVVHKPDCPWLLAKSWQERFGWKVKV